MVEPCEVGSDGESIDTGRGVVEQGFPVGKVSYSYTPARERVVDINASAPSRSFHAPRPQAITPPAPHAAPPLEPQAQRAAEPIQLG